MKKAFKKENLTKYFWSVDFGGEHSQKMRAATIDEKCTRN